MAYSQLHFGVSAGVARIGAIAATVLVGVGLLLNAADAQAPKKDKAAPGKGETANTQSAWVKLCETATATVKQKDGKEDKKDLNICLVHHERIDGNSGMVLVSAALREIEGQDKKHFMVMVPLGMLLQPGMRATIFPKNLWDKVQKNEKIEKAEEAKLKGLALQYTLCHIAGCTAEMEASPELVSDLKGNGGLMVFAISAAGTPVAFPVPLAGFEQAMAGPPVDTKKYGEARKALMVQIVERQQQIAAELKKQNDDLKKMMPSPQADQPAKQPPAKK
jgi:invasion protein IalB